jgi:hypothetical protein
LRYILALSLTIAAAAFVVAEAPPDAELARARARAAIAIESAIEAAKIDSMPMELHLAALDAAERIELAKAEMAKPEKAPAPKKLPRGPCSDKCTCGCQASGECKCIELPPGLVSPAVLAPKCYIDKNGRKVCPNAVK